MSKERLEEMNKLKNIINSLDDSADADDFHKFVDTCQINHEEGVFNEILRFMQSQAERVRELEEDCEYLSHHYGLEAEKNKRYREAIDKSLHKCDLTDDTGHDYTDEIRYELRKALEGEE